MMVSPASRDAKVLVVDDHVEFIERLTSRLGEALPSAFFDFEKATTGEEALQKLESFLPDVILLDNILAAENSQFAFVKGADFYRELKRRGYHGVSVIILTYDEHVHNAGELVKMGVKRVVNKADLYRERDGYRKLASLILSL